MDKSLFKQVDWHKQLKSLEEHARKNLGFEVEYEHTDCIDYVYYEEKRIVLHKGHSPEMAFYCLLHELGHVALMANQPEYEKNYNTIWNEFCDRSLTTTITFLHEELDAWREGLKVAEQMNFEVNRRKYEQLKAHCLATFIPMVLSTQKKRKVSL